jgi:hypothetical protein
MAGVMLAASAQTVRDPDELKYMLQFALALDEKHLDTMTVMHASSAELHMLGKGGKLKDAEADAQKALARFLEAGDRLRADLQEAFGYDPSLAASHASVRPATSHLAPPPPVTSTPLWDAELRIIPFKKKAVKNEASASSIAITSLSQPHQSSHMKRMSDIMHVAHTEASRLPSAVSSACFRLFNIAYCSFFLGLEIAWPWYITAATWIPYVFMVAPILIIGVLALAIILQPELAIDILVQTMSAIPRYLSYALSRIHDRQVRHAGRDALYPTTAHNASMTTPPYTSGDYSTDGLALLLLGLTAVYYRTGVVG